MTGPLLLCTDLDRTLLPNGTQPESPQARELFARLVAHAGVTLALVSGRDRPLVERAIAEYDLPRPDFVVADVGTSVYDLRGGDWESSSKWHANIAPCWSGVDRSQLEGLLAGLDGLRLQEATKQNTFKLSYYVPLDIDRRATDALIEERLRPFGVSASHVWSVDEPASIGLLDVIPAAATKLHAVDFLWAELGFSRGQVVFAGDSGNDLEVLASSIPSVLVANATAAVTQEAITRATAGGHREALHVARGDLLEMNGNYAAGVLEGVAHFRPDLLPLLQAISRDLPT